MAMERWQVVGLLHKSSLRFKTSRILSPISVDNIDRTLAGKEMASWT